MSWDIAIDENGEPLLIEMNPRGDIVVYQVFGNLPFGERTQEILDEYLLTLFYNRGADWYWDYKEYHDHVILTKYAWDRETVRVPEKINGKLVTGIEAGCFTGQRIRRVVIPGSVKSVPANVCGSGVRAEVTREEDKRGIVIPVPEKLFASCDRGKNMLRWTPVEGVTDYRVFRMPKGGTLKFLRQVPACVTSYADYDVLGGEMYYYYVRSYNSAYGMSSALTKPAGILTMGVGLKETSEIADAPETPETAEITDAPEIPEASETPESAESADAAEAPTRPKGKHKAAKRHKKGKKRKRR